MKASTQYNDFVGSATADISDFISQHNSITDIADLFDVDKERFEVLGLSIYGTNNFSVSLICKDIERSSDEEDYIVSMMIDKEHDNALELLFKRLNIMLFGRHDNNSPQLECNEEVRWSDFHEEEENE